MNESGGDCIGGFPCAEPNCKGCGEPLTIENAWMTDGCPCNTPLGVNSMNETRWRLLMELQQRQSRQLEQSSAAGVEPAVLDLTDYGFGLCVSKKDYDHLWDCYKLLHHAEQQATARLRKAEAEARIKGEFLSSRQCPDHNGKWEPGRCLQCELEQSAARLREMGERHGIQLAAISVAALANTQESAQKQRIERDNEYWTQAYQDVLTAVEREMKERERADQLERDRDAARELLSIHNLGGMTDYNDGPMKRALAAERDREALRKDAELLDWLEKNYHASEVDEYAAQGNARWVFSTPLLGSWAPLRARLRAALSASPGARE